jgi:LysM repeat protein
MIFVSTLLRAQSLNSFVVDGAACVNYTVKNGENIGTISTAFKADSNQIKIANKLTPGYYLPAGKQLVIPVSGLLVPACKNDENCIAVYYSVQQSEGLYRIGKYYGNIKPEQIKQLNHLSLQNLSKGQQLLIGYLAVSNMAQAQTTAVAINNGLTGQSVPDIAAAAAGKDTSLQVQHAILVPPKPITPLKVIADTTMLVYKGNGFFAAFFADHLKDSLLNVATFKSESGWADGKFYALVDHAEPGGILKITNPENGRFIFAKIVGSLPHVKHDGDIQVRVSSAGMIALGFYYDKKYEVRINY